MDDGKKHKLLLGILIALIIILLCLMALIYNQLKNARNLKTADDLASSTITTAIKSEDNVSVSYNLGSPSANSEVLDDVKDMVNRFMEAKAEGNLEQVKQYMTKKLAESIKPEEFLGTSSHTLDKFEITEAQAIKTPNTYEVRVLNYWKLDDRDAEKQLDRLIVIRQNDIYLVSEINTDDRPL